jgi:hypothetical protein
MMTADMRPVGRRVRGLWDVLRVTAVTMATLAARGDGASTGPTTRPLDPDLYGWWNARDVKADHVADASGHGRAAKAAAAGGTIATETVGGRVGFRVKGDGGAISPGADAGFDFTADFSVALRVKLSGEQTDVVLLSKRDPAAPDGWAIVHGIRGFGGFGFVAAPRVLMPTPIKAPDDWVHLAVTFQQRDFLLYVDGKAIGTMELPHVPAASKQPLMIGAGAGGKGAMDGWLDDVRIYHRGVTAAEVEALAAGREPANPYTALSPARVKAVKDLVRDLGADSFARRERAAAALRDMGRALVPLLKDLLGTTAGEPALRIKGILGELPADGGGGGDVKGER